MTSRFKCLLLLAFGFSFLRNTDGERFRCDYKFCSYSKAWYKFHQIPAPWPDARLMCALEGGILASPITPEIRSTMTKSIKKMPIFVGLHATVSKANYVTVEGIDLEEIRHGWAEMDDLPDYHKGGCLTMDSQGLFRIVDCYKPRPYMCYRMLSQEPGVCGTPDPEYRFDGRTNKCYKFHTVPRNYSRADFACSAEGGHLAIINSEVEAKILHDIFSAHPGSKMVGHFWKDVAFIGFHDWGEHGEWRTVHGQTLQEAGYSKFSLGEPNNSTAGEFCGSIYRSAQLNDLWCEKRYAFICEKRPDFPPICDRMGKTLTTEEPQVSHRRFDPYALARSYRQYG